MWLISCVLKFNATIFLLMPAVLWVKKDPTLSFGSFDDRASEGC